VITSGIMNLLHGLASTVFGWLHDHLPAAPGFWTDMTSAANTLLGQISAPVRYFIPIVPVVAAATALTALIVALGLIRLARRVVSLFSGGGGSA
jgi:hypothetical protein